MYLLSCYENDGPRKQFVCSYNKHIIFYTNRLQCITAFVKLESSFFLWSNFRDVYESSPCVFSGSWRKREIATETKCKINIFRNTYSASKNTMNMGTYNSTQGAFFPFFFNSEYYGVREFRANFCNFRAQEYEEYNNQRTRRQRDTMGGNRCFQRKK